VRIKYLSGSHDYQTPGINELPNIKKIGELYGRFFLGIRTLVVEHGDSSPFTSNGQRVKG